MFIQNFPLIAFILNISGSVVIFQAQYMSGMWLGWQYLPFTVFPPPSNSGNTIMPACFHPFPFCLTVHNHLCTSHLILLIPAIKWEQYHWLSLQMLSYWKSLNMLLATHGLKDSTEYAWPWYTTICHSGTQCKWEQHSSGIPKECRS